MRFPGLDADLPSIAAKMESRLCFKLQVFPWFADLADVMVVVTNMKLKLLLLIDAAHVRQSAHDSEAEND